MSRTLTLWGYALVAGVAAAYQAFGLLTGRTATLGQALGRLKRRPGARAVLLAAWLWFGWHTFVRGTPPGG